MTITLLIHILAECENFSTFIYIIYDLKEFFPVEIIFKQNGCNHCYTHVFIDLVYKEKTSLP